MNNKQRPILSVVVPAYNAEKTLERCIDSLLNQGEALIEIIISNDGSTDRTQQIIDRYTEKHPCISFVVGESGGSSCARNRGIKNATGQWITFVDADDYITPGIYDKVIKVLETYRPDMLEYQYYVTINGTDYETIQNKLPKNTLLHSDWVANTIIPVALNISNKIDLFIENYVWNKAYRAEIIRKNAVLFDETRRKWEDRLFSLTFLQYAKTYYSMSEYGYHYVCGNSQTLSGKFDPDILRIIMDSYCKYLEMYGTKYCFDNPYTTNYFCNLLIDVAKEQFGNQCAPEVLKEMFEIFVTDDRVKNLFEKYDADNAGKKQICKAIWSGNVEKVYDSLKGYAEAQKRKEKVNRALNRIRSLLSRLKQVIVHEK